MQLQSQLYRRTLNLTKTLTAPSKQPKARIINESMCWHSQHDEPDHRWSRGKEPVSSNSCPVSLSVFPVSLGGHNKGPGVRLASAAVCTKGPARNGSPNPGSPNLLWEGSGVQSAGSDDLLGSPRQPAVGPPAFWFPVCSVSLVTRGPPAQGPPLPEAPRVCVTVVRASANGWRKLVDRRTLVVCSMEETGRQR